MPGDSQENQCRGKLSSRAGSMLCRAAWSRLTHLTSAGRQTSESNYNRTPHAQVPDKQQGLLLTERRECARRISRRAQTAAHAPSRCRAAAS